MFERFTNQARRSLVLAQEQAAELHHNYIGTEHLLLGLLDEGQGVAARALAAAGVALAPAQQEVEAIIGRGAQRTSGHIPFTPRAKKCLELSLREALDLGHNYISSGHLLLGLIREGDGVAITVLGRLGAELGALHDRVVLELEDHPEDHDAVISTPQQIRLARDLRPSPVPSPASMARMLGLLESIDKRLSVIERYLGIAGEDGADEDADGEDADEGDGDG